LIRGFEADEGGEPYVPPPRFGSNRCTTDCENIIEDKLHSGRDHCWRWDEEAQMNGDMKCQAIWDSNKYNHFKTQLEDCFWGKQLPGEERLTQYSNCLKTVCEDPLDVPGDGICQLLLDSEVSDPTLF
jgi:hypothetical protein